jgi:hypothetical protein
VKRLVKAVGNFFYMLLTILMIVMFALVVFILGGSAVASGYRAFDLLSKGEIAKGLFEAFSAFLFGSGFIRAFQPSKWTVD